MRKMEHYEITVVSSSNKEFIYKVICFPEKLDSRVRSILEDDEEGELVTLKSKRKIF